MEANKLSPELTEAKHTDYTVYSSLCANAEKDLIILALVREKKKLLDRINELLSICPRKISNGKLTYVWHCPDDLIPEEKLSSI